MNDQESIQRLTRVEERMLTMSDALGRIEQVIQRVINPIDRSLAELTLNMTHMAEKLAETREQTVACAESHRLSSKQLDERLDKVHEMTAALENKTTAGLRVAQWFCGGIAAVTLSAGGWLISEASTGSRMMAVQQQRIEQLEKQIIDIRHEPHIDTK